MAKELNAGVRYATLLSLRELGFASRPREASTSAGSHPKATVKKTARKASGKRR
jgi:hypothetical protein